MINHPDQIAIVAARLRLGDPSILGCCYRTRKQLRLVESSVTIELELEGRAPWVRLHHIPLQVTDLGIVMRWPEYEHFLGGVRLRSLTWIELGDARFPEGTELEWLP